MRFGSKTRVGAVFSVAALAAWLGYRSGYQERSTASPVKRPGEVRTVDRSGPSHEPKRDPVKGLRGLRGKEQGGLRLSHQALADSWALVRTMTIAEIRAALDERPRDNVRLPSLAAQQVSMLYYRWAQLDPLAAATAQKDGDPPSQFTYVTSAVIGWMTRDPDAAFHWAAENGSNRNFLGYVMSQILTAEEPASALAKAAASGDEVLRATLNSFGRQMSASAEGRESFVALLSNAKPEQREQALKNMTLSWSAKSPAEALDGLGLLPGLSGEEARQLRKVVTEAWQIKDPAACVEAISQPGAGIPREDQIDAYARWTRSHPTEAAAWSEGKSEDAGFYADAVQRLAAAYPGMALNESSPDSGDPWQFSEEVPILRLHFQRWQQRDPAAAAKWLAQADASLRDQLTPQAP